MPRGKVKVGEDGSSAALSAPSDNNKITNTEKELKVGSKSYSLNTILDTAGKRRAITAINDNKEQPALALCTRYMSVYGSQCSDSDCPYIHIPSCKPVKAPAQTALCSTTATTITKLYYNQQKLHISNPGDDYHQRMLEGLNSTFWELHQAERVVVPIPSAMAATKAPSSFTNYSEEDDDDNDNPRKKAPKGPDVDDQLYCDEYDEVPVADDDDDPAADEEEADGDEDDAAHNIGPVAPKKTIIVAIDPIGTKLRDDAISCEFVSESVIAVTSYTPNFVDTGIASGRLTTESLHRAYSLFESHFIHSPERLWGQWVQYISFSTTKTVSAIAATRHYDVQMCEEGSMKVVGVSEVQPPEPLRIEDVRLTDIINYEAASGIINDNTTLLSSTDDVGLERTLSALAIVAQWWCRKEVNVSQSGRSISAEPTAEFSYNSRKVPNISISYRGFGDHEQDSLAHGVVNFAVDQMKEVCCSVVDKTRTSFQTARRQLPNETQLAKLCEIAGMPHTDEYQAVSHALSKRGFNVLAIERSIGCNTSEHLVLLSDKSSLACTKPLRSFLSCYHQFLVLDAIDPTSNAAKHRSALLRTLPPTPELLKDFNLKRDSLALTMFKRSQAITQYLALAAPHIQVPVDAVVSKAPTTKGGSMKVFIPQLTAPNATPVILTINHPSELSDVVVGQTVTLMMSVGRLANPLDESAGVCTIVSEIPPPLLPPCFRGDGVVVEGEEDVNDEVDDDTTAATCQHQHQSDKLSDSGDQRQTFIDYLQQPPSPIEGVSSAEALPIETHIKTILKAVRNNRVVCLKGDTGCGKSSMTPLRIYQDAVKHNEHATIIVTQPRRIAAIEGARRVAKLLGEEVGQTVGYRVGGGSRSEGKYTQIYFVTSGYISRLLSNSTKTENWLWNKATHIILDEVHERSLDADMLSLVLKLKLQQEDEKRVPPVPSNAKRLIVMSATIQSDLFRNYFAPLGWDWIQKSPAATLPQQLSSDDIEQSTADVIIDPAVLPPLINVGGSRRHVAKCYISDVVSVLRTSSSSISDLDNFANKSDWRAEIEKSDVNAIRYVINACVKKGSCILVFLPGLKEIDDVAEELGPFYATMVVHKLHSSIDYDVQKLALIPATMDECKVVLSTNIAETSITIPDVKIVIDLGLVNRAKYDQRTRKHRLECGWCSKATTRQRAGRAGRVSSGIVLSMYPKDTFDNIMPTFEEPELNPLESSALQMHVLLNRFGTVKELMKSLVEPPNDIDVDRAMDNLVKWGALGIISPGPYLSSSGPIYQTFPLGKIAASLTISVPFTKAIVSAGRFGCATDMIVVICGLLLGPGTLVKQPYKYNPTRPSPSSHFESQSVFVKACRSILHFDRSRVSDLHFYIAVVEEYYASVCNSAISVSNFANNHSLSLNKFKKFLSSVKSLCMDILRQPSSLIELHDSDTARLLIFAGMDDTTSTSSRKTPGVLREVKSMKSHPIHFPSLHDPLRDELFQLTLVHDVSECMFWGKLEPNQIFKEAVGDLRNCERTLVFSPISHEIANCKPGQLKPKFSAFGFVNNCSVVKDISGSRLVVEFRAGDLPQTANGAHNDMSLPHSCSEMCSLSRQDFKSDKYTISSRDLQGSSKNQGHVFNTELPKPGTPGSISEWTVCDDLGNAMVMDKYSVVGNHSCSVDSKYKVGFATGVTVTQSQVFGTHSFLIGNLPGLPLISRLCNISGIINTFSRYGTVTIERKKGLFLFTNAMYAGIAPLPVLLMVNLLLLLRGPLCPTHDMKATLVKAYGDLRSSIDMVKMGMTSSQFEPKHMGEKNDLTSNRFAMRLKTKLIKMSEVTQENVNDHLGGGGMGNRTDTVMSEVPSVDQRQRLYKISGVNRHLQMNRDKLSPVWNEALAIYNTAIKCLCLGIALESKLTMKEDITDVEVSSSDDENSG